MGPNDTLLLPLRVTCCHMQVATAIAAGKLRACAIVQPGGRVKCWG